MSEREERGQVFDFEAAVADEDALKEGRSAWDA